MAFGKPSLGEIAQKQSCDFQMLRQEQVKNFSWSRGGFSSLPHLLSLPNYSVLNHGFILN